MNGSGLLYSSDERAMIFSDECLRGPVVKSRTGESHPLKIRLVKNFSEQFFFGRGDLRIGFFKPEST